MYASASAHTGNQDLFNQSLMEQPVPSLGSFTDMFALNDQPSSTVGSEVKELSKPLSESVGWATFDVHQVNMPSELHLDSPAVSQANIHPFSENTTDNLFLFFENQNTNIMPSVTVTNSQVSMLTKKASCSRQVLFHSIILLIIHKLFQL